MDKKNVIIDLDLETKEEVLDFLSKKACELSITGDSQAIKEDLINREEEMSTALVEPLAIPHAKSKNVFKNTIIFLRLNNMIDWSETKVKIIIGIFSKKEGGDHIDTLANLSRKLIDREFIEFLETANVEEIYEQLKEVGE
ncbi:PTS sugar transporter subunit IIA [Anaerococcus sp. mt242]|uniref:PTS sugar transporter subunit IIA n=1 Tax=Anaerococcus sp. mt242 TaxID=2661917 RepID=UPI0019328729|nr:PTS sugar transporter subunit IIA [Anaerococcus sp. mt242]MBM0046894.1 PTS sugar transporter subunit IIA [Anaerococcus sp. mt242]